MKHKEFIKLQREVFNLSKLEQTMIYVGLRNRLHTKSEINKMLDAIRIP